MYAVAIVCFKYNMHYVPIIIMLLYNCIMINLSLNPFFIYYLIQMQWLKSCIMYMSDICGYSDVVYFD